MTPSNSTEIPPRFKNPDLPLEQRIEDLLFRLTLPEKINQLMHENNAVTRLGIPAYNWWNEACHGVGRNGRATVFPQVIALAATWDRDLVLRVASVISDEARAKHHAAFAAGLHGQYQGLTFWTPNINIFRDPRWGRGQESFGEDPFLCGELGSAMVRGLQGDHPKYLKTAACAKHFAVHSGPEQARHTFDAQPSLKDLYETYLPAFEKLVRTGVEAVMGAYNRVLGEPACASQLLLEEILRKNWNFQGHVVSDCGAIDDFHQHHKVTANAAASAALAVRRGCDLNCGCTYNDLNVAVQQGLITEQEIDVSLRRLLATKFRLGLFDPSDRVPWSHLSTSIIDSAAHRALARDAAAASIVLLKNEGVLPLRRNHTSLLVTGPTAASITVLLGNYFGVSSRLVTLLEGITDRVAEGCRVAYRTGCPLDGPMAPGVNYTYATAADCEITIAVLGLDPSLEGEEGDAVASSSGGDREAIELPAVQLEFFRELRRHARKLIVVLTGGSAIAVPEIQEEADAVVHAWYPGCEGGAAVADVLFGEINPSGRLPVTVPRCTSDLPPFEDYSMAGRTYRFAKSEPLYPFGFGLGYATIEYGPLQLGSSSIRSGETLSAALNLSNTSDRDAVEVVQCYLTPPPGPCTPLATLVDFRKVVVRAWENIQVEFEIPSTAFEQIDAHGRRKFVTGSHHVTVGPASPGPRAQALGAPAASTSSVLLV
ncbi:MAG TPA: glycoside hydrolase family 3 N-terminal domain-containing protein [Opitutaceae bacterium]|nr:glycoside hydrolase family 3 N-terminal domain-containing protein [Opitutaceae bacterium]